MQTDSRKLPRSVLFLLAGYAVNFFGSGLTLPFLMVYLHAIRHVSLAGAGFVLSLSSIVGFIFASSVGGLIDKMGTLKALVGASILLCLGTFGYAVSTNLPIALVAASMTGLGNVGMWTALSARMVLLTKRPDRSRAFGIAYAVQNLGLGLGSGVAGMMVHGHSTRSYLLIFLLDAVTYLLFIPFVLATKQTNERLQKADLDLDPADDLLQKAQPQPSGMRHVLKDIPLVAAVVLNLLYVTFGFSQLNSSFSTWTTTGAGAGASIAGMAFFGNCIVIAIVQIPVLRWTENWRRTRLAMACGLCFAVCWLMTVVAGQNAGYWTDTWLISSLVMFGVGETFLSPSLLPMVNDLAPDHLRGRYNAMFTVSWQAGTAIGPLIAGFGIAAGGKWLFVLLAGACLVPAFGALWMERVVPLSANRSS